jgi:hypothetical protein
MKTTTVVLIVFCLAVTGGTLIYLRRDKTLTPPVPVVASSSDKIVEQPPSEKISIPKKEPSQVIAEIKRETNDVPANAAELKTNAAPSAASQTADTLLSTQISFLDKRALRKNLKDIAELDLVIAELKQRAADNPTSPDISTTLGEVELQKADVLSKSGGNLNEMAIVAMQADQHFDAALKLDASNWEAQFYKAAALAHWPADLGKSPEVIQRLSNLIDQQDTMPSQPQFAYPYVILGEQYQKAGKPDYAEQTWRLGAQKFPGDTVLQNKISTIGVNK